jgi:hypothetical protein
LTLTKFNLTPAANCITSHRGALHFYGHSRDNLPGDAQCLDVGVDCWDFRPVSLAEVRARLATLPARSEPDHIAGDGSDDIAESATLR